MGRLFVLFFLLPWWAYVPASIGVLWLGERAYEQALETEAEKASALEAAAPAPVDLGQFDRDRDIHAADEVHVVGLIDHDLDYELVERTNGVPTTTRYLYMIFGATETAEAKVVRAALLLDKREEAKFIETKADEWALGASEAGWVYAINGFASTSATLDSMASDAIEEQGLTKAEDFIYIEPFFEGREAALTPQGMPEQARYIGWLVAAVVALIGVAKRILSVRARLSREAREAGEAAEIPLPDAAVAAPATGFAVPSGVSEDTPLGRLARRSAPKAQLALDARPAPTAYDMAATGFDDPEPVDDPLGARTHGAPVYDSGAPRGGAAEDPFPPVPDDGPAPAGTRAGSDVGFYAKLALAMLVVGAIAYDPSILSAAMPFASVALFWLGVYLVYKKVRSGGARLTAAVARAPKHQRRPDGSAQTVAVGVGGHRIDLTPPVRRSRRERGVI